FVLCCFFVFFSYLPPPPNYSPPKLPPQIQHGVKADQSYQRQQTSQQSVPPQKPYVYEPKEPKHPAPQDCAVDRSARVQCGAPDISATACEAINCCFDGQQCYFGKAVTVQCTKDAHFIVVVAKEATLPNLDLEAVSLLGEGQGCSHVDSNSQFAIYHFPVTACGSLVMEEPGAIIYENRMTSAYEVGVGPRGAITRDSSYELLFRCRYTATSVETLIVDVLPLTNPPLPVAAVGPIRVEMRLANGQCTTKGCNEVTAAYSSFYTEADYPVSKVLRDPVYVDVQLLGKTDQLLVLTLDRCWVTANPYPHSLPQWNILTDGCPCRDDRYLSSLVPVDQSSGLEFPSHHRRFIFKMFTFVNPSSNEPMNERVYIHCSTAVCYNAPGARCEPMCLRRTVSQEKSESKVVVSSGPLAMASPEQ
uniref:Zona pellucida sperm-binding protein 4 n=1 Tax=Stegastes partitus TaxID=144197 RepID=A0A3B5A5H8_9TELE